jgi:XTP/dITP diphosphohydrolase
MKKIVFATNNAHKLQELRQMLGDRYEILGLADIGCHEDIPETADNIEGNAQMKASYVKEHYGYDCFSDDTGLEIDALNGEPGVHSARYVAEHDFAANLKAVLKKMEGAADRSARFVTVLALVSPDGVEKTAEGEVRGTMATEPHGEGGFGYDPAFIPEGYDKTFGELPAAVKNSMSHRARALQNAIKAGII